MVDKSMYGSVEIPCELCDTVDTISIQGNLNASFFDAKDLECNII
jgi:hypothetical protein